MKRQIPYCLLCGGILDWDGPSGHSCSLDGELSEEEHNGLDGAVEDDEFIEDEDE